MLFRSEAEKEYQSKRKQIQEKIIKFATRIPIFMYLTDYRERTLKDVITKLELDKLLKRVLEKNYNFTYEQDVVDYLSNVGFDETFGARPIKRAIQSQIEDFISDEILKGNVVIDTPYTLGYQDDTVVFLEEKVEKPKKTRKKKTEVDRKSTRLNSSHT